MVDAYTKGRSETLVVPKVYPVWKSKEVTYTLTDGLIWDYYDLLVENDGVGGMLSAEGMSDTVTVTGHTWSEWVTLFEPSAEGPGQQQRVCSHCGKTDSRTVDGVWQIYDLADHLLELPEGICGETNLWPMLPHEDVHFTSGKKWGVTSTPTTSITIPVEAGDRIYATSWNKAGENGHATSDGIRLTFFDSKGIAQTLGPGESYRLFAANGGYLVAPEGSIAVNIVMWYDSVEYEVYILNREHTYTPAITAPTCTEQGYTTYTCACGDSYVSEHTAPTGHAYGEWKTTKDATFTEDGEESHACTKCSHVEFRAVPLTVVTSGNLGYGTQPTDAVIYTLYSNGTMVVEGTGVLFDCYWDGRNQPFIDYRSQIKHLIIGEGVTSTRGGCFAHLKNLETVQLPSTLTSLSKNAFMSSFVESVTEFTIPASVTNLGSYSLGHYGGDASAYFTDIIIENPNIKITDEKAVFNGGSKLDKLTLYSYGNDNAVRAYAEKYGIAYIDLDSYAFGSVGEVNYRIYNGVLTIYTDGENVVIPANDLPWNAYKDTITRIVIQDGITVIYENAFTDYPVLEEVVLPECLVSIGNSAFSVTNGTSANLHIALPKRI